MIKKSDKTRFRRQVLKGYATGGRTYGFISEPVHGPGSSDAGGSHGRSEPVGYRIKINQAEAAVVRRIFQDFRDGYGEKAIAKKLNGEKNGRVWRPNTVFLMLRNQKSNGPTPSSIAGSGLRIRQPDVGRIAGGHPSSGDQAIRGTPYH